VRKGGRKYKNHDWRCRPLTPGLHMGGAAQPRRKSKHACREIGIGNIKTQNQMIGLNDRDREAQTYSFLAGCQASHPRTSFQTCSGKDAQPYRSFGSSCSWPTAYPSIWTVFSFRYWQSGVDYKIEPLISTSSKR